MATGNGGSAFGIQLRRWRHTRNVSQLQLAIHAGVSARHLSFIETGRALPSREMVLLLTVQLRVPLRERNAMLLAAGFAPAYEQRSLDSVEMSAIREAVQRLLDAQEPYPALAVDRQWNVVLGNRGARLLSEGVAPSLLGPSANVYRVILHPDGLRARIRNFDEYAGHLLAQLQHDVDLSGDPQLHALLAEVEKYPGLQNLSVPQTARTGVALPLQLATSVGELAFVTTVATFGTPYDVTVSELAVESFFPADAETAQRVRAFAGGDR